MSVSVEDVNVFSGGKKNEQDEDSWMKEWNDACTMSYTTRLYCFGACFVLGWFICFLSVASVSQIKTKPQKFAILYTLGNIISLSGSCFLFGPCSQLKSMFKPVRAIATIVFLVSMVLTVVLAFTTHNTVLVLLCILIQCCAGFWYALSYIPYGRTVLLKCMSSCFGA